MYFRPVLRILFADLPQKAGVLQQDFMAVFSLSKNSAPSVVLS
jgi:hypothetical protein